MTVVETEGRRVRALASILSIMLLLSAAAVFAGCSDSPPPTDTLAALAAAVGDSQPDTTDFDALVDQFASPGYQAASQSDQANYQLFLTAKAAQMALPADSSKSLEVSEDVSGDEATVVFKVLSRDGVFSVADVSTITVQMVKGDDVQQPWLIDSISLAR